MNPRNWFRSKRATLVLAALALLCGVGQARAGNISPQAEISIFGSGSGNPSIYFNQSQVGDSTSLGNSGMGTGNGIQTVSAIYATNPTYDNFMGGQANAHNDLTGSTQIGVPDAVAIAQGSWRDIVYLNGVGTLPSNIMLTFTVEGTTGASTGANGAGRASFGAGVNSDITTLINLGTGDLYGIGGQVLYTASQVSSGWKTLSADDSGFSGTFTYIASYNPTYGGYPFQLVEVAYADAQVGTAFVQFNDPLSINFVTNTDGTPITDFAISFDSGLAPTAAAPEPSSLILLGIGIAGMAVYGWRRRTLAAVPEGIEYRLTP